MQKEEQTKQQTYQQQLERATFDGPSSCPKPEQGLSNRDNGQSARVCTSLHQTHAGFTSEFSKRDEFPYSSLSGT